MRGYFSQEEIELPPAYTQEYISLEKNSIPTRKTAETWDHPFSIAKEMPDKLDCPVGLLIGYDCTGALKPKKVIAGEDHVLFTVKTKLGWHIVGPTAPLNSPGNTAGYCYWISSKEIPPIISTSSNQSPRDGLPWYKSQKKACVTRRYQISANIK